MKKKIFCVLGFLLLAGGALFAQTTGGGAAALSIGSGLKYLGAGLAVGLACIAGGIAVGQVGAGAMGAMSEDPSMSGKAMPFVGLAEGICLWGFIIAIMIMVL
jgi:V/A-type H+-transporting ATPase subunit K